MQLASLDEWADYLGDKRLSHSQMAIVAADKMSSLGSGGLDGLIGMPSRRRRGRSEVQSDFEKTMEKLDGSVKSLKAMQGEILRRLALAATTKQKVQEYGGWDKVLADYRQLIIDHVDSEDEEV